MGESREVWEQRVQRLRDSELKTGEFAAELGINPRTLTYWKWRLGREARSAAAGGSAKQKATFVEVKPEEPRSSVGTERIEIVLDEGRTVVRVPERFDLETLRRVVVALASRTQ